MHQISNVVKNQGQLSPSKKKTKNINTNFIMCTQFCGLNND